MNIVFIVNEHAGNGRNVWQRIQRQLTIPYDVYKTAYKQHATAIAAQIAATKQPTCLIAVGGDGTIHEVISGIVGATSIIVGVFSAGSGNDFGRAYEVFDSVAALEQWYETKQMATHDIGTFQQAFFMNNAGFGFDAYVAALANASTLKNILNRVKLGKLAYIYFLVRALFTYDTATFTINGERYEHVWFITVSNQPYFGGGMKLSPHSKTNDGMLECTVVHHLSKLKLLTMFVTVFWGGHTHFREVTQFTASSFQVDVYGKTYCHIDGETFVINKQSVPIAVQPRSWQLAQKKRNEELH